MGLAPSERGGNCVAAAAVGDFGPGLRSLVAGEIHEQFSAVSAFS
jgi:hypothetical protein